MTVTVSHLLDGRKSPTLVPLPSASLRTFPEPLISAGKMVIHANAALSKFKDLVTGFRLTDARAVPNSIFALLQTCLTLGKLRSMSVNRLTYESG